MRPVETNQRMWIDDQVLKNFQKKIHCEVFVPEGIMVVLGSGNDPSLEVDTAACQAVSAPILRRYGGGGTVVLYPGCVVLSVGCWVKEQFQNSFYFSRLNQALIESLAKGWSAFAKLSQAGISDIVFGDKKVAGTSMFRSRNYLLYQASILVDLDANLVGNLLKHPTKEPDYRKGRCHSDFLTSLREVHPLTESAAEIAKVLKREFESDMTTCLGDHLIEVINSQTSALTARLGRASIDEGR